MPLSKRSKKYSPKKSKVSKRKQVKKGRKNSRKKRTLKLKGGAQENPVNNISNSTSGSSTATESISEGFQSTFSNQTQTNNPPVEPATYILWYGPISLAFISLVILIYRLRQQTRK